MKLKIFDWLFITIRLSVCLANGDSSLRPYQLQLSIVAGIYSRLMISYEMMIMQSAKCYNYYH